MSTDLESDSESRRICGLSCHHARRAKCNCWCDGLFHGKQGAAARKVFIKAFGFIPAQPRDSSAFHAALQLAKDAR